MKFDILTGSRETAMRMGVYEIIRGEEVLLHRVLAFDTDSRLVVQAGVEAALSSRARAGRRCDFVVRDMEIGAEIARSPRRDVQRCEIQSHDGVDRLAVLEWEDGTLRILEASPGLRVAFERWVAHGLMDWVEAPYADSRITLVTDPAFLPRLREHLRRVSGFQIS